MSWVPAFAGTRRQLIVRLDRMAPSRSSPIASDSVIDTLVFGNGIALGDLLFSRVVEDSRGLRITFKNVAGSIIIDRQTWGDMGIERLLFADGTTLTQAQANALLVIARNGNDNLTGTAGDDHIWALEGADTISGLAGSDSLHGQDGADILFGDDGDDLLVGGRGTDILTGGDGSDIFRFAEDDTGTGTAADRVSDFTGGIDILDLAGIDADATASAARGRFHSPGSSSTGTQLRRGVALAALRQIWRLTFSVSGSR